MIFKINTNRHIFYSLILLLLLHAVLLVNTKFTLWPEMVVYPYLLNNGFQLYKDIINPYPPAFTFFLALISKIFGYTPYSFQILSWLQVIIIDLIIFTLAVKTTKKLLYGLISAAFFIFFSIPFGVNGLWFDLIQTPFIFMSVYLFYRFLKNEESNTLLLSFLFVIFAFFIKQQAVWLALWYITYLLMFNRKALFNNIPIFQKLFAFFFIIALTHVWIFNNIGILKEFIFWTVSFPLFTASSVPGYILPPTIRQVVVTLATLLIFTPLIFNKKSKYKIILYTSILLLLFAYPRFDYFHLVPLLAVLSLLIGPLIDTVKSARFQWKIISMLSAIILIGFSARYYMNNWSYQIRFLEPEITSAASFLSIIVPKDETVYIQNGPDQLLPLSGHLPPKPWADEFPWYMEIKGVQRRVVEGIETADTKFVVFQPYTNKNTYDLGSYKPSKVVNFIDENFQNLIPINNSLWLKIKK